MTNINTDGKLVPQDVEAEKAVLGSMMLENPIINDIIDMLQAEDFYLPAHQYIYSVISDLYSKNTPVDYLTVTDSLRKKKLLSKIGGATYLTTLTEVLPSTANAVDYAKIIVEKSTLRQLIKQSTETIEDCYNQTNSIEDIMDFAEKRVFAIADRRISGALKHISEVMSDTLAIIHDKKEFITGVPTGFKELDEFVSGFQPGQFIILAARPGVGKSALAMNIATNAATEHNMSVAYFSLEMTSAELGHRILCSEARVNMLNLKKGRVREEEYKKLNYAISKLSNAPIYIDDNVDGTVMGIRAKARRLKAQKGLDLIIIDYLQLLRAPGRVESKQYEVSQISRELKLLAKELDIPILALSQLSRKPEERTDHIPILADLRDSGSIEQDADLVLFIVRPEMHAKEEKKAELAGLAYINIAKQRNGPSGMSIKLTFLKQYTKFENIALSEASGPEE